MKNPQTTKEIIKSVMMKEFSELSQEELAKIVKIFSDYISLLTNENFDEAEKHILINLRLLELLL